MTHQGSICLSLGAALLVACSDAFLFAEDPAAAQDGKHGPTAVGGSALGRGGGNSSATGGTVGIVFATTGGTGSAGLGALCDPARTVRSDGGALLEQHPEVMLRFSLERVLERLLESVGDKSEPEEFLQRLFDTQNAASGAVFAGNVHCDSPNNEAFLRSAAVHCPRAEGTLAESDGLFVPEDLDYFFPIALINRFDLAAQAPSRLGMETCGEFRIIYAKWSGRTDRNDRLFLILEAILPNPAGDMAGCRSVAELWAKLESDTNPESRADQLERFFLHGLPGFAPALDARHFGVDQPECGAHEYARGLCGGQIRLGQGMQVPWEFRQVRLARTILGLQFVPVPDSDSVLPELFDPASVFRVLAIDALTQSTLPRIRLGSSKDDNAGDSALDGPRRPSYLLEFRSSAPTESTLTALKDLVTRQPSQAACTDDPITLDHVLERATALSCAGCHAPERLLLPGRQVGCGQVWPKSLGEAHIDEFGRLSEALTDVFLPHRAEVLTTFLQACDAAAIVRNLQPAREEMRWSEGGGPE